MINLGSSSQIGLLFFGGTIKTKIDVPILNEMGCPVLIKSGQKRGQIKTKKEIKEIKHKGLGLIPHKDWLTPTGKTQVNEKVLKTISKKEDCVAGQIAKELLQLRKMKKEFSTYYIGFEKYLHPDGLIHGQISHCGYDQDGKEGGGTGTGRTSSVSPNLQNITR